MKTISTIKGWWTDIPTQVSVFLKKSFIIFIIWKVIYHLILFPIRFPDRQLTVLTANAAVFIYKSFHTSNSAITKEAVKESNPISVLYIDNHRAVGIADSCNGLELYVLYIGFLFCLPASTKKRVGYIVAGIFGIFILNSLRCYGLAWLYVNEYAIADFAHKYLFKIFIYGAIFFVWVKYSEKHFKDVS